MDSSYPTTEHAGKEKGYVWLTDAIVSELEHSPHSCIQLHTRRTFSRWRSMKGKFAEINLLLGVVSATRPTMYVLFAPLSVSMFQCCALIPAVSLVCLSHLLSLLTIPHTRTDRSRLFPTSGFLLGTLWYVRSPFPSSRLPGSDTATQQRSPVSDNEGFQIVRLCLAALTSTRIR